MLCVAAGLASCGQSADENAATNAAKPAKPAREKPRYCFFKDEGTKDWKASVDAKGDVVVKGRAFRADARYKAVLGEPKVNGTSAEVWPSVTANDTGFAAPDNWWEVAATIPNSGQVETVQVRCGKKVLAELKVPRKP
jgi:hypothetical protein